MFKYKGMSLQAAQLRKRARNLPPLITNVIPIINSTFPPTQIITIIFNKYIQPGSAYNNIYVWDNNYNTPKAMTKTINNNKITITTITPLINGRTYSILIPTNAVKDLAGNPLQNPLNSTFTFKTPEP